MPHVPLSAPWALALLGALAWTTAFSLVGPPWRGLRNVGLLASYALGAAMAVAAPWREAACTWAAFGLAGGAVYLGYELWSARRHPGDGGRPGAGTLLHGLAAWPLMLPEAVEYVLAELGALPTSPPPAGASAPDVT